jgi:hypothetical protein
LRPPVDPTEVGSAPAIKRVIAFEALPDGYRIDSARADGRRPQERGWEVAAGNRDEKGS